MTSLKRRKVTHPFEAGVYEYQDGMGFVVWSRHSRRDLAVAAAVKYALRETGPTGGVMTGLGGVRVPDGSVTWYTRDGSLAFGEEDK